MTILRLYVAGTPRPQPRPRFVNGRAVSTASRAAKVWSDRVRIEAICTNEHIATACGVHLTFHFPTKDKARWGKPHTCRPDKDNCEKLILDSLVKAGVLADDSLVAEGFTRKQWAQSGGVEILVYDPAVGPPIDDDVGAVEIVDNVDGAA